MAQVHDFKPVKRPDTPAGFRDWHCKKCDSVMRYDQRVTQSQVNMLIIRSGFLCIPPLPEVQIIVRNANAKRAKNAVIKDLTGKN